MVTQARKVLLDQVIKMKTGSSFIFQEKIDIPEETGRQAALLLADAGWRLYQGIFFGSETDPAARNMGARLRDILTKNKDGYKIQIFAKRFSIPWGMLYLSEKRPKQVEDVDTELFMGLKHVVEQVPLQESLQVIDSNIDISAGLKVSLNLNTDISPLITNNRIESNGYADWGGGIYCWNNSNPTISGNMITGNTGGWGGGVSAYQWLRSIATMTYPFRHASDITATASRYVSTTGSIHPFSFISFGDLIVILICRTCVSFTLAIVRPFRFVPVVPSPLP